MIPEQLYHYRVYGLGCALHIVTSHQTIDILWDEILKVRNTDKRLKCWAPTNNGYIDTIINPDMIVAIDTPYGQESIKKKVVKPAKNSVVGQCVKRIKS